MTAADLPLMKRWLEMPHMREWWGDPETELGYIRDMIEDRDTTRPFIFSVDGEPVGYIQYWFIGHHQNAEWFADHPWLAELPAETIGVDLSIGEPANLSRGFGSAALRTVCRAPDRRRLPDNHHRPRSGKQARRQGLCKNAGFRAVPRLVGRSGDALIMQYQPTESSAAR